MCVCVCIPVVFLNTESECVCVCVCIPVVFLNTECVNVCVCVYSREFPKH